MKSIFSKNYLAIYLIAFGLIAVSNNLFGDAAQNKKCNDLGFTLYDQTYTPLALGGFKDKNAIVQMQK